jgi:PPOX class probable F420-dependent enzyme
VRGRPEEGGRGVALDSLPRMDRRRAADLVAHARVARLATQTRSGRIDLVPITYALDGERLVTAIDHKPKTTTHLKRLENIEGNPEVSVLVDEYDDDQWDRLWWVRLRGLATVVEEGHRFDSGIKALVAKYRQYYEASPSGPVIFIELVRWQWWSAT